MIQNICTTCRVCASPAHAGEHDCCTVETKYRQTRPLETRDRSGNTVTCLVQIERPPSRPSGILIPPGSARGLGCFIPASFPKTLIKRRCWEESRKGRRDGESWGGSAAEDAACPYYRHACAATGVCAAAGVAAVGSRAATYHPEQGWPPCRPLGEAPAAAEGSARPASALLSFPVAGWCPLPRGRCSFAVLAV